MGTQPVKPLNIYEPAEDRVWWTLTRYIPHKQPFYCHHFILNLMSPYLWLSLSYGKSGDIWRCMSSRCNRICNKGHHIVLVLPTFPEKTFCYWKGRTTNVTIATNDSCQYQQTSLTSLSVSVNPLVFTVNITSLFSSSVLNLHNGVFLSNITYFQCSSIG